MQTSPLQDFITDLALDPVKYAAYVRDPDAAMRSAGLTVESQSMLKSGDSATISSGLAAEAGVEGYKPGFRAIAGVISAPCPGSTDAFKPLK